MNGMVIVNLYMQECQPWMSTLDAWKWELGKMSRTRTIGRDGWDAALLVGVGGGRMRRCGR